MFHHSLQRIIHYTSSTVLLFVFFFSPIVSAIPYAQAGGLDGRATLGMQVTQQAELAASAVANTATAASNASILGLNVQDFSKEFVLDGLAFAVAKNMVSQMTQSLLNWINSGFAGSPAFITDLNQMLLNALDETAGEFISSLGGIGEFICSPFQLDVQAALAINYAQARSGMPSGPTAPSCSLSDIGNNVENFLQGVGQGGLDEWLTITSNPQNTPYGAYLAAEASLNMRLRNEAGQEIEIASWGDGFMSKRICQAIEGSSAENCTISTPGQVISEALTFQLSTGPRALIEADEINEIIGALINQLTLQAMQGINGLLGLTSGEGYGVDGSQSYIDAAVAEEAGNNSAVIERQIDNVIATEQSFLELINSTIDRAEIGFEVLTIIDAERAVAPNPSDYDPSSSTSTVVIGTDTVTIGSLVATYNEVTVQELRAVQNEAVSYRTAVVDHIITLQEFKQRLVAAGSSTTDQLTVANDFLTEETAGAFHTPTLVAQKRVEWNRVIQ